MPLMHDRLGLDSRIPSNSGRMRLNIFPHCMPSDEIHVEKYERSQLVTLWILSLPKSWVAWTGDGSRSDGCTAMFATMRDQSHESMVVTVDQDLSFHPHRLTRISSSSTFGTQRTRTYSELHGVADNKAASLGRRGSNLSSGDLSKPRLEVECRSIGNNDSQASRLPM